MTAYFERLGEGVFRPTGAVQGAWNTSEQHIAPVLGLIAHVLEADHRGRQGEAMQLARVSYDILGVLPIEEVSVETRVLRPGRTIELAEATLSHAGRPAVVARAWWMQCGDTAALAGTALPAMPGPDECEPWNMTEEWAGAFLTTLDTRRRAVEPGRGHAWVRSRAALVDGEPAGPTTRLLGLVDVANGIATRVGPDVAVFPNLDLTVHLLRAPIGEWIGLDTTVSFAATGVGVTHSILHDERGPVGTGMQSLTVRPR